MIKKTLTYTNYNNVVVTKDFWFHLTKADMIELAIDGDFETRMKEAIRVQDKKAIFQEFRKLIFLAVGVRSEDGESFAKPEMFREAFMTSPAFDELLEYLFGSEDRAAEFISGLLPAGAQEAAKKELAKQQAQLPETVDPFDETPAWEKEDRDPTETEVRSMTREQLVKVTRRKLQNKS